MMKKRAKIICSLFVSLGLLLTLLPPVSAVNPNPAAELGQISSQINNKQLAIENSENRLNELKSQLETVVKDYQNVYNDLQKLEEKIAKKQKQINSVVQQQLYYQKVLNQLTVFAYRDSDVFIVEVLLGSRSFHDFLLRSDYLNKLNQRQAQVLKAAKQLRAVIEKKNNELKKQKEKQRKLLFSLQSKQDEITRLLTAEQNLLDSNKMQLAALETQKLQKLEELRAAEEQLKQVSSNVNIALTFPIPQPYAHSYINDWGFPRAGNPSGHQGTDIFAQKGTPVIAVADGVIGDQFGFLRIGGFRLHLIADNGVDYYYAHLNNDTPGTDDNQGNEKTAYAPGIAPGVRVKKGQIIGYVGDSGDAEPTPAHLHFGIIVNGNWINPYPYLKAADWK